ncbi:MAG TPA: VWA domain-containing protein [Patescibacteria group bacterium]|nr:VWA domain-containing protein [Patescibacteria group bacterium]
MKEIVIDFVRVLREAGVPATTMEAEDSLKALELVGFSPKLLKSVLQTTLVKSSWERPIFERLFALYFELLPPAAAEARAAGTNVIIPGSTADGSGRGGAGAGGDAGELLEQLKAPHALLEELARAFVAGVTMESPTPREVAVRLHETQVQRRWFEAVNRIERRYDTGKMSEADYLKWQERFRLLQQLIQQELEKLSVRKFGREAMQALVADANIRQRQFSHLTSGEIVAVEQEIVKLARKLAERPGIRMRRARRGQVALRRTFQEVLRTGGCPIRLRYQDRVKSKVDLLLLCDVSNSVERFSRFMLQLVQAAQKRYSTVRSFVFVDQAVEVTEWFRSQNVSELLEARHMRERFSRSGLSRYDLVFEQMARHELLAITSRTKVIILGDAKNNWRKGEPEELAKIADRAKAVYWLNPLPEPEWWQGDCLMREYAPFCRQIFECRTLEQLSAVANQIL